MNKLTEGSITRHLLIMAAPISAGMLAQMLYHLVDLYFVSSLGDAAVAGLSSAGNVAIIVFALTQVLGVGTAALISHAVGRDDRDDANLIFNQALVLSAIGGLLTLIVGVSVARSYLATIAADAATLEAGATYLMWFLPGLALQFAMLAMGSALRGTGVVKPTMLVQMLSVALNALLAPILIVGWLTGHPLGVAGAGLASSLAIAVGVVLLWIHFHRLERYVIVNAQLMRPKPSIWKRILAIGLPAGGEFALTFIFSAVVYYALRNFGATAQAGYGIGQRVLQALLVPAMGVGFAAGPVAGQNFGAGHAGRVIETFRKSAWLGTAAMLTITALAHWRPELLIGFFTNASDVRTVGVVFLEMISWTFVAQGLIFTCSSMFQGLGNTRPSLVSSGVRLVTFALPCLWLSERPAFRIEHVWYLSMVSAATQALVSVGLLQWTLRRRLGRQRGAMVSADLERTPR
jgi:putative MATE family efflux protein